MKCTSPSIWNKLVAEKEIPNVNNAWNEKYAHARKLQLKLVVAAEI